MIESILLGVLAGCATAVLAAVTTTMICFAINVVKETFTKEDEK